MFESFKKGKSEDIEDDSKVEKVGSLSITSWYNDGLEYIEQQISIDIVDGIEYFDENECSVEDDFTEHILNTDEVEPKQLELEFLNTIDVVEVVNAVENIVSDNAKDGVVEGQLNFDSEELHNELLAIKNSKVVEENIEVLVDDIILTEPTVIKDGVETLVEMVDSTSVDENIAPLQFEIGVKLIEPITLTNSASLEIDEDISEILEQEAIEPIEKVEEQVEETQQIALESTEKAEEVVVETKVSKPIRIYEYVCVIFVALTMFFGISYISWSFDNSNTHGVVSGLISETTSKHNMTVTADTIIDDVQIGQIYDFLEVDFEPLIKRNADVQGYLKVKALESLEYPVMQSMDNEYYLDKDIDKNKSGAGWLFIDCRNNIDSMQFNTIIYGHNRIDGLMFGSLKHLLKVNLVEDKDADKIYFNTRNNQMIYEICSVYVTTFDDWEYYDVDFSEKQKENFITRLNKLNQAPAFTRSDLSTMDNFITLSTCHGSAGTEKRLVVHARLIAIK